MTPEQEKYGKAKHEEIASRGMHPLSGGLHANPMVPPVLLQHEQFLKEKSGADTVGDASGVIGEASSPHTFGDTSV